MKKYFPYLSDSSYISVDETPEELERMKDDFPLEDFLYPLPYETMRKLSIPAVDLGVFGKGRIRSRNGSINLIHTGFCLKKSEPIPN